MVDWRLALSTSCRRVTGVLRREIAQVKQVIEPYLIRTERRDYCKTGQWGRGGEKDKP